ncbi:hypothetical protein PCCS19_24390 [Paenibacillus sp. CCS19]|nr:hypothetical protein PCCS19_24390 [Paenibacillus cellulosilyticus]
MVRYEIDGHGQRRTNTWSNRLAIAAAWTIDPLLEHKELGTDYVGRFVVKWK